MGENRNGKNIQITAGAVLLILIIGYILWTRSDSRTVPNTSEPSAQKELTPPETNKSSESPPTPNTVSEPQSSETKETKEITVLGNEFRFDPSTITVNAGDEIRLTFKNMGQAPHNLTIKELNITTKTIEGGKIKGGPSDTIKFTAPKSGTLSFYCSVGNHAERGMMGTMMVN